MDNNNHRQGLEIEESDDDEEIAVGNDIYLPKKAKLTHHSQQEEEEEISSFSIDDEEGVEGEEEEEEENKNLVAEDENPYSSSVLAFLRTAPNLTHNNKNGGSSPASTTTASSTTPNISNLLQSSDASTSDSPPLSSILQSAFAAAVASGSATGKYSCLLCPKKFDSSKMLQQHNQSFHTDKQFVCEICDKAFRFRSNLAEHRSVHTAIKPFVCRFCGKSSRLKGNLTKHILKHHKKEQNDYIGTDDIIIKKGKKSVKDPAAIDFLEKSMIVLNGGNVGGGGGSGNASGTTSNPSAGSGSGRAASIAESLSGSSTPMGGILNAPSVEEQQRCFLMSLGLEPGSIDLKAESPDSDSSIGSQARTTNDQLLEKCNAYAAMDVDLNGSGGSHQNEEGGGGRHSALTEDFLSHFTSAAGGSGGSGSSGASNVNAAVATLASLVANNNNSIHHRNNGSSTKLDDSRISEAVNRIASSMQTPQSSISGTSKKTQCPECGKHMRKPKDLVTHLTTIHRYSPYDIANVTGNLNLMTSTSESPIIPSSLSATLNTTTSSSGGADTSGISDYGRSALTTELKQIQKTLNELKSQRNVPHLTQAVNNLDTRIGRMEKQLEMVLNTLYTLVQLQTGNLTKSK